MCLNCHEHSSDESVVKNFRETLENPQFEQWNSTSVSHLQIAMTGLNGTEAKRIALEVFSLYEVWARNEPGYGITTPKHGLVPMQSLDELQKWTNFCRENNFSQEMVRECFYHGKHKGLFDGAK